jgi:hypothetical protein
VVSIVMDFSTDVHDAQLQMWVTPMDLGLVDDQNGFQPTLAQSEWVRAPRALAGGHHRIGAGL